MVAVASRAAVDAHGGRAAQPAMDPAASKGRPPDDVATEAFAKYDTDGDGKLSKDECVELIAGLGLSVTRQYLDGVWTVYGRRRDAGPRGIP